MGKLLWQTYDEQQDRKGFDLDKLGFAIIWEGSELGELSEKSFNCLLSLFDNRKALGSSDFHSITTAIWGDEDLLSSTQLEVFFKHLKHLTYEGIDLENRYSVCDMISNLFTPRQASDLLNHLSENPTMQDAARYLLEE